MIAARTWTGVPHEVRLTASVGVAVGSGAFDSSRVLAEAATALQQAKREGRDRIMFR
jgi:GGDEF domain-containing protein